MPVAEDDEEGEIICVTQRYWPNLFKMMDEMPAPTAPPVEKERSCMECCKKKGYEKVGPSDGDGEGEGAAPEGEETEEEEKKDDDKKDDE